MLEIESAAPLAIRRFKLSTVPCRGIPKKRRQRIERARRRSSAKRIYNGYTFNFAPVTHILGQKLSTTERTGSGDNRCVPIG